MTKKDLQNIIILQIPKGTEKQSPLFSHQIV